MKRLRVLQMLNFWRLIPAYMCICMAPEEVKNVVNVMVVEQNLEHLKKLVLHVMVKGKLEQYKELHLVI